MSFLLFFLFGLFSCEKNVKRVRIFKNAYLFYSVDEVLALAVDKLKELFRSWSDDWVDRMNHVVTAVMLLTFAGIVSTKQLVSYPIHCWCPAEFTGAFEAYINNYCWIKNTYYIPPAEGIPLDVTKRHTEEITYYQWVPLILLLQAFLFKLPNIFWRMLNSGSGLNLKEICIKAQSTQCESPKDRTAVIENLACILDRWSSKRMTELRLMVGAKARISHLFSFLFNKKEGTYLIALYLSIKLLYLVNVIAQFFILNAFMATNYSVYGFEFMNMMTSGESMRESPRFPRVTLCDVQIRQLQNVQRWTVQCTLPINFFNEKIFIFLWFWFFFVACLSGFSLAKWIYLVAFKRDTYRFVRKYLKISESSSPDNASPLSDKTVCHNFAESYLSSDGCFVVRMIGNNSTDIVVMDLLNEMWKKYKNKKRLI